MTIEEIKKRGYPVYPETSITVERFSSGRSKVVIKTCHVKKVHFTGNYYGIIQREEYEGDQPNDTMFLHFKLNANEIISKHIPVEIFHFGGFSLPSLPVDYRLEKYTEDTNNE